MQARSLSFVAWSLLAASLVYWSFTLVAKGPQAPAQTRSASTAGGPTDWTRLFAAQQEVASPVESVSSRYQLLGVVAPVPARAGSGEGVALIAISGAPPRSVRIGQVLDGDLELIEINKREVGLGRNGVVSVRLQLVGGADSGAPVAMAPPMMPPPAMLSTTGMDDPTQQGAPPAGSPLTIGQPLPQVHGGRAGPGGPGNQPMYR